MTKINQYALSCAVLALFAAGVAHAKQTAKVYCAYSSSSVDNGINSAIANDARSLRMGVKSISKPSSSDNGPVCVSVLFSDDAEYVN